MKGQLSSCDEDEYNELSRSAQYCWWRSAAKFDECVKLKYEIPNVSTLTPRLKVLREMERLALIAPEGLNEVQAIFGCLQEESARKRRTFRQLLRFSWWVSRVLAKAH
jgi:hypothetical protein